MENASKALLIAGGMLILIVLVSIILLVKANVEKYYASENELEMIADTTKFNEQFTRFNRSDLQGYELISLANKVVDYNERVSDASNLGNDKQADPIQLTVVINSLNDFAYEDKSYLFKYKRLAVKHDSQKAINEATNYELKRIIADMQKIENENKYISVLTKKIRNIILPIKKEGQSSSSQVLNRGLVFNGTQWKWNVSYVSLSNEQKTEDIKSIIEAIGSFQTAMGDIKDYTITHEDMADSNSYGKVSSKYEQMIKKYGESMYKYYEYTQFKKAKFKCTLMHYNEQTGKIDDLKFEFTGKIE